MYKSDNENNRKTAVIYLPETGIVEYLRSLSLLGDCLKKAGYIVYLVNCNNTLPRCPMCACYNLPYINESDLKKEKCAICYQNILNFSKEYDFKIIDGAKYYSDELRTNIENIVNTNNLREVEYKGLAVGKIALHDFMIETKLLNIENLSYEHLTLYKNYIKAIAITFEITEKIIGEYSPSIILAFNPYSQTHGIEKACLNHNVIYKNVTNMHHLGANFALYQMSDFMLLQDNINYIQEWNNKGKDLILSPKDIKHNFDDTIFRMFGKGSHIFSATKSNKIEEIYSLLGFDKNKKIITLFTNSYDERLGLLIEADVWKTDIAEKLNEVFENQVEWIEFVKNYAKEHPEIQFIVKIHPREGRDGGSEHLKLLKETFKEDYVNFKILWPETPISTYDLLEIIDGCLIGGSTVGHEAYRLGIPVLNQTSNWAYPNEGLFDVATTKEEYKQKLDNLINSTTTIGDIVNASRFYNWKLFVNSLYMGEDIKKQQYPKIPDEMQEVTLGVLENKINTVDYNIERIKNENNSPFAELNEVKRGIRRIIDKIYFPDRKSKKDFKFRLKRLFVRITTGKKLCFVPEEIYKDYELRYSEDISKIDRYIKETKRNKKLRYIVKDDIYSVLIINGKSIKHASKTVSNLAKMHCEK